MPPPATPFLPPSIPLSPPNTPPSVQTHTGELCGTETQLDSSQPSELAVQDSPQQKTVAFDASTNTSFGQETAQEGEHPEVMDTATNTSHTWSITETGVNTSILCGDTVDAGTNTSPRSSETEATKRLEVAQLSNSLLRASLEDCQQQISSLEAASEALREEVRRKDARLATLSARLAEVARTFEVSVTSTVSMLSRVRVWGTCFSVDTIIVAEIWFCESIHHLSCPCTAVVPNQ